MSNSVWRVPIAERILDPEPFWMSDQVAMRRTIATIEKVLAGFRIPVYVVQVDEGPRETLYTLEPRASGRYASRPRSLSLSSIQRRAADLALSLAAPEVSVRAAGAGREGVILGIPHSKPHLVVLRTVLMSQGFAALRKPLRLALGLDAGGSAFAVNLRAMPHVLIGGTAGSGKSTCIHAFIASLLLHNDPDTVRFLLIDTKMVELGLYNDIPHLTAPVIMDPEQAASALETVRAESRKRLEQFRALAVRDISAYNRPGASAGAPRLPFLVIVVDDVAELLAASPGVAAQALASLAADGRPAGIHLIASTSRPSDSLVARSIKGNFPARIAFRVTSAAESRIILDRDGAEKLLRDGDMLFLRPDSTEPVRIQGAYVSDGEIHRIADYWRKAAEERQRQEPDNSQTNE